MARTRPWLCNVTSCRHEGADVRDVQLRVQCDQVYVDIVETISCTCNGSGIIASGLHYWHVHLHFCLAVLCLKVAGGISGEVLMTSKLSGIPEAWHLCTRRPALLAEVRIRFRCCSAYATQASCRMFHFIPVPRAEP